MDSYTERLELADGQWATLLTRLPADRTLQVRSASARYADDPTFIDAVCRAVLWEASLRDYLTGETVDENDYGRADPVIVDQIQARAFALYVTWAAKAFPKAKAATAQERRARRSSAASPQSEASKPPTTT